MRWYIAVCIEKANQRDGSFGLLEMRWYIAVCSETCQRHVPTLWYANCVESRKDENETIARTGIGDAASCETPCKRKSQSDWAQLGDKNIVWRRASERVGYEYEEKILIPQPTLSEAPVVSTLLSPSFASLQARTLAWCFASFGISDTFTCAFIYPLPHAVMQTIA